MDNVFVFVVIFAYFGVPLKYQYRVLFWGILGAIALRLLFIVAAASILHYFEWAFYIVRRVSGLYGDQTGHVAWDGVASGPEHFCEAGTQVSAGGAWVTRR